MVPNFFLLLSNFSICFSYSFLLFSFSAELELLWRRSLLILAILYASCIRHTVNNVYSTRFHCYQLCYFSVASKNLSRTKSLSILTWFYSQLPNSWHPQNELFTIADVSFLVFKWPTIIPRDIIQLGDKDLLDPFPEGSSVHNLRDMVNERLI